MKQKLIDFSSGSSSVRGKPWQYQEQQQSVNLSSRLRVAISTDSDSSNKENVDRVQMHRNQKSLTLTKGRIKLTIDSSSDDDNLDNNSDCENQEKLTHVKINTCVDKYKNSGKKQRDVQKVNKDIVNEAQSRTPQKYPHNSPKLQQQNVGDSKYVAVMQNIEDLMLDPLRTPQKKNSVNCVKNQNSSEQMSNNMPYMVSVCIEQQSVRKMVSQIAPVFCVQSPQKQQVYNHHDNKENLGNWNRCNKNYRDNRLRICSQQDSRTKNEDTSDFQRNVRRKLFNHKQRIPLQVISPKNSLHQFQSPSLSSIFSNYSDSEEEFETAESHSSVASKSITQNNYNCQSVNNYLNQTENQIYSNNNMKNVRSRLGKQQQIYYESDFSEDTQETGLTTNPLYELKEIQGTPQNLQTMTNPLFIHKQNFKSHQIINNNNKSLHQQLVSKEQQSSTVYLKQFSPIKIDSTNFETQILTNKFQDSLQQKDGFKIQDENVEIAKFQNNKQQISNITQGQSFYEKDENYSFIKQFARMKLQEALDCVSDSDYEDNREEEEEEEDESSSAKSIQDVDLQYTSDDIAALLRQNEQLREHIKGFAIVPVYSDTEECYDQ